MRRLPASTEPRIARRTSPAVMPRRPHSLARTVNRYDAERIFGGTIAIVKLALRIASEGESGRVAAPACARLGSSRRVRAQAQDRERGVMLGDNQELIRDFRLW
jgi:hypothetical protein